MSMEKCHLFMVIDPRSPINVPAGKLPQFDGTNFTKMEAYDKNLSYSVAFRVVGDSKKWITRTPKILAAPLLLSIAKSISMIKLPVPC